MEAVERVDCGVRRVVADTAQVIRAYHRAGHRTAGSQCAECCSLTPRPCTPDAGGATAHNVTRRAPNEARVAVPESAVARERLGLGQKIHEADRRIAATALRLDTDLASADAVFRGVSGLSVRVPASA
jgi:hypothetical protein